MEKTGMIILPLPPSVNAAYGTNWTTKRRFRTKVYEDWVKASKDSLWGQTLPEWVNGPIKLELAYAKPLNKDGTHTKVKMDVSNRIKATEDFLVHMKIIEDDSQVEHLTVYWDYTKEFEGVRIDIKEI